jgi:hypothetical protein
MSAKSRRQLTIQGQIAASVLFAAIGVSAFAASQKIVWRQGTATVLMIAAAIFCLRIAWQQKRCTEPMTPALKQLCKRVAGAWALITAAVLFIVAMRANTPRAWIIVVVISVAALAGAFWERPPRQT